jgi:hypothetical protein
MREPEVIVLGVGLRGAADVTLGTLAEIQACDLVLHLVNGVEIVSALHAWNSNVVSLLPLYQEGKLDLEVYEDITLTVLREARTRGRVGLVVMGHPSIYVAPTQLLLQLAQPHGVAVHVIPALSSIDAIMPVIELDIGSTGLQVYDANRLVDYDILPRPDVPLLIFQAGCFGSGYITRLRPNRPDRLQRLVDHLCRVYPRAHAISVLECQMSAPHKAVNWRLPLATLAANSHLVSYNSTLYLPPSVPLHISDPVFHDGLLDPAALPRLVQ